MGCKEGALKPSLQLFITLDPKGCLISELRFPIVNLLNMKKVMFLPPVNLTPQKISNFHRSENGLKLVELGWTWSYPKKNQSVGSNLTNSS